MVYRFLIIYLIMFFFFCVPVFAAEVSMLDRDIEHEEENSSLLKEPTQVKTPESVPLIDNPENNATYDFIEQENQRLREIKLLDLDLQRADLRAKISKLDQDNTALMPKGSKEVSSTEFPIKLKGVMSIAQDRQALMMVNEKKISVRVGGVVGEGFMVMRIDDDKVVLKDKDGKEKIIVIGG